jgi:hypothetical protein
MPQARTYCPPAQGLSAQLARTSLESACGAPLATARCCSSAPPATHVTINRCRWFLPSRRRLYTRTSSPSSSATRAALCGDHILFVLVAGRKDLWDRFGAARAACKIVSSWSSESNTGGNSRGCRTSPSSSGGAAAVAGNDRRAC